MLERLALDVQHGLAEHLQQPPVGVPGEPLVAGLLGQALHRLVGQADVQHRLHHARHRELGPGPHADQQRVGVVAEPLAHLLLQLGQVLDDLLGQAVRHRPLLQVVTAGLGGDDEPRRDGQAQVGHLGQVGALAAQQVLEVLVSLGEVIDKLRHCKFSSGMVPAGLGPAARRLGGRDSGLDRNGGCGLAAVSTDSTESGAYAAPACDADRRPGGPGRESEQLREAAKWPLATGAHPAGPHHARRPRRRRGRGAGRILQPVPALGQLRTDPGQVGAQATVRSTATGAVLARIRAPRPDNTFTAVSAADDDRTFAQAATHATGRGYRRGTFLHSAVTLCLLKLSQDGGGRAAFTRLPLPQLAQPWTLNGLKISPDGQPAARRPAHRAADTPHARSGGLPRPW